MALHNRRYFVKNIPTNCSENDFETFFHRLGKISDVSIGSKASGNFAFFTVEGLAHKIDKAVPKFASKEWNGCKINLELAKKDSFISRLKKEQEENKLLSLKACDVTSEHINNDVHKVKECRVPKRSSKDEHNVRSGIPMFAGTQYLYDESQTVTNGNVNQHRDIMPSFSAYDSMWNDGDSITNADVLSSFVGKRGKVIKEAATNGKKPKKKAKEKEDGSSSVPITKIEKKKRDDERRRQSLSQRAMEFKNQQKLISSALSVDAPKCKKIRFDLDDKEEKPAATKSSKQKLFDDEDEDEVFDISLKTESGFQKSHKLMALQSKFNHDERFKVDERFLDDEEGATLNSDDCIKETRVQEMVRFDPSKQNVSDTLNVQINKKVRKADMKAPPVVSKETFYEVSQSMKSALCEKTPGFSLLAAYGGQRNKRESSPLEEPPAKLIRVKNPFINESSDEEEAEEVKDIEKWAPKVHLPPGRRDNFFFSATDPLFDEALEFMCKKNSEEAKVAAERYGETRRQLKKIIKGQIVRRSKKADMFRKKVGGMKKRNIMPNRNRYQTGKRRNHVKR